MEGKQELKGLLSAAVPKPASVGSSGAALALAVHCVLVRRGFNVEEQPDLVGKRPRRSSYMPPVDWQAAGPNEWNFAYSMHGKARTFKLTVALQEKTGRVLVHASEEMNPANIQLLGLNLENYVNPDSSALKSQDWSGVVQNEEKLTQLVVTHIVKPLVASAEDLGDVPPDAEASRTLQGNVGGRKAYFTHGRGKYYIGGAVLVAAIAVGVAFAFRHSRSGRRS